jgi:uncharacterized protein YqjF (DUF2071 family)
VYKLPYFRSLMSARRLGPEVEFSSARREGPARPFVFQARYRPVGEVFEPQPGTLDHFLTERYVLFVVRGEKVVRGDIHHRPWPLRAAEAEIHINAMTAGLGIELAGEPLLHFSARQDTLIWGLGEAEQG